MDGNVKQYQQLNKSIQKIFSSSRRVETSHKQIKIPTQQFLNQSLDQENYSDMILENQYQNSNSKNGKQDFQNYNLNLGDQKKTERLFSDESASDCSSILKPSLPQTPTQNIKGPSLKNKLYSFSNISKANTNTHVSLSPKTISSIPQSPQLQKLENQQNNEKKKLQNKEKQKYFSHFRNFSNPCILNTGQQELLDQNQIEKSNKTQILFQQNQNFQLNENKSEVQRKQPYQIKFTNSMIQSKVVSLQTTPKQNKLNFLNSKTQKNKTNEINYTVSSENIHGIHLFHTRNQHQQYQKQAMLQQQQEQQQKMNKTIFSLNNIIPNLYYMNSNYQNEKDLIQLIERKQLSQRIDSSLKDIPQKVIPQKVINIQQFLPNNQQHRQIRSILTPQNTQKQNKVIFSSLLSQTFSKNFEQYDVIESGISRKLKQNIRQKSAISQSLNNSQVHTKNFNQQVSFDDDFEDLIQQKKSLESDNIIENENFDKNLEEKEQNQIEQSQQQYPQSKEIQQNYLSKNQYPVKSCQNSICQSSIQNLFFKEKPKLADQDPQNGNYGSFTKIKAIVSNQRNFAASNQNSKQNDENNSKYVKLLLKIEQSQQIQQFKMINKSQSFVIKNKEQSIEKTNKFPQKQINKVQSQKNLIKQSNPFQLLSSANRSQNQYNYMLKKDLLFKQFLEQEKYRLKQ